MAWKVGSVEVIQCPTVNPDTSADARHGGLQPGTTVLRKGHKRTEGAAAFQADTIFERDVPVPMRDGTILRADIFRPAELDVRTEKVPVLLAWSPYGKTGAGKWNHMT
jgi:uncharacterized protein